MCTNSLFKVNLQILYLESIEAFILIFDVICKSCENLSLRQKDMAQLKRIHIKVYPYLYDLGT